MAEEGTVRDQVDRVCHHVEDSEGICETDNDTENLFRINVKAHINELSDQMSLLLCNVQPLCSHRDGVERNTRKDELVLDLKHLCCVSCHFLNRVPSPDLKVDESFLYRTSL